MSITQEGVFIGANKQAYAADHNPQNQLIAYGASNNVALWHPLGTKGVYHTLKEHSQEVTGVKFVPATDLLVSVAEDAQICVWKRHGEKYALHQTLLAHTKSITCLAVIDSKVFVTGGADGQMCIWVNEGEKFELAHQFEVRARFYPMTLAIQSIDAQGRYILAVGGTKTEIYVYGFQLEHGKIGDFHHCASLEGHEDWIKCLEFVFDPATSNYILASGSQDRYIRLWRLRVNEQIDDSDEDDSKLVLLSNKQYKFELGGGFRAAFSFDALIMGHDDWVTALKWNPANKLQLLSSSADTALMVWEMDEESGIWCCINRLGEMSIKGASTATGASGGFWSCLWIVDDDTGFQYILAHGKTGSFRVYRSEDSSKFEAIKGPTGPTREVTDVKWSLNGEYFVATSLDQTTRLFAPWKNSEITWHEFARPQIHGYDMICIDNISGSKYVSGGDEKVLRVFEMTHSISKLLERLCDVRVEAQDLPESASLPVLGLSNKAANEQLEAGEASQQQQDAEENVAGSQKLEDVLESLESPPLEDYLQRYTLFPESDKLYGHGYEITCCAVSRSGLIASACRSNSAKHAVIRVFDAHNEYQQQPKVLAGHNLTITSMEFSPDGQYLLAVSRDRQYSLWRLIDRTFELVELNSKAHSRIIWDCSWASNSQMFVTGSRDKQIKVWKLEQNGASLVCSAKLAEPVTSVSCYPASLIGDKVVVAAGTESGAVIVYGIGKDIEELARFDDDITPAGKVTKLSFSTKTVNGQLMLVVGSADSSVRLYTIKERILQ